MWMEWDGTSNCRRGFWNMSKWVFRMSQMAWEIWSCIFRPLMVANSKGPWMNVSWCVKFRAKCSRWIDFFGQNFSQYTPYFMIVICWHIGEIEQLKVLQKEIHWEVSLSVILSILAPTCAFFTVLYLFPPPNTLLSWYYCQILCLDVVAIHVLSICHQDMWIHWLGLSCLLDFRYLLPIFGIFSVFLPLLPWCKLFN